MLEKFMNYYSRISKVVNGEILYSQKELDKEFILGFSMGFFGGGVVFTAIIIWFFF